MKQTPSNPRMRDALPTEWRGGCVVVSSLMAALMAVLPAVLLLGCAAPPIEPDLTSDRADRKVPALIEQAQRGDDADYAALVRALDDDDPAIRFVAVRSLETLTGQDMGYRFFDGRLERQDAVARWQDWLIQRQTPAPPISTAAGLSPPPKASFAKQNLSSDPTP